MPCSGWRNFAVSMPLLEREGRRPRRAWGALALLIMLAGGVLTVRARAGQPRRDAELAGLRLRLERAVWLHEPTDHGDAAALPVSEGVPAPGQRRLAVALTAFNPGAGSVRFSARELGLVPLEAGAVGDASPRVAGEPLELAPGQLLSVSLDFDVPSRAGALRLEWRRGTERAVLLATRPPPSVVEPEPAPPWPRRVEQLPPGDAVTGRSLYFDRFACATCHGDPARPDDARIGPSLHGFARVGATRIEGLGAAQYAYESLLDPGAFIAPECAGRAPCARPSTMPLYGDVLSPGQMADLIHYLVEGTP